MYALGKLEGVLIVQMSEECTTLDMQEFSKTLTAAKLAPASMLDPGVKFLRAKPASAADNKRLQKELNE